MKPHGEKITLEELARLINARSRMTKARFVPRRTDSR